MQALQTQCHSTLPQARLARRRRARRTESELRHIARRVLCYANSWGWYSCGCS
jgi:hypothetical protein